jgi:hypothetical protein
LSRAHGCYCSQNRWFRLHWSSFLCHIPHHRYDLRHQE